MSVDPALLGHIEIETSDAMEQLGFRIGEQLEAGDLLILTGPLGAGKTTFTRGLAEGLAAVCRPLDGTIELARPPGQADTVSYTHLTLPTSDLV